jgi:RNA polymerase sigma-70 factor (ECF subfamily)
MPTTDFHELYVRYADEVYRFALFLCGDAAEAQEIAAETFARALTGKVPLIDSTVKAYLLTIARNFYIEITRQQKRRAELSHEIPDSRPELEHIVSQRTELQALQKFLQTIPEADRTALLLRADGMTYQEIARTLNLSLASAKVKVHRVRLKLAVWRAQREQTEL